MKPVPTICKAAIGQGLRQNHANQRVRASACGHTGTRRASARTALKPILMRHRLRSRIWAV